MAADKDKDIFPRVTISREGGDTTSRGGGGGDEWPQCLTNTPPQIRKSEPTLLNSHSNGRTTPS